MTEQNPNPVVVAVGSTPIEEALQYAAAEAARIGCGLHLVHVLHVVATGAEMVLVDVTDAERIARSTLREAVTRAEDLAPDGVTVTGEVVRGAVVPAIVDAAQDARLIVLQHRALSRLERVVTRSVSGGVAARAHVPVVSVPGGWVAGGRTPPVVAVGIDVPDRSQAVLSAAAAAARVRGATLRVLHTWSFAGAYEEMMLSRVEHDEWADRARAEITAALERLGDELAGVDVRIETEHAPAADSLVAASHDCDLLVVGRHDPMVPFGSHLGPVARAVLREAACPVLLANPREHRHHGWPRLRRQHEPA